MPLVEKTIPYKDIDDNPALATYHFKLGESELAEMEMFYQEDLPGYFKRILKEKRGAELIKIWKSLLLKAVGVREGMQLVKNDEIRDRFVQTGCYNAYFLEVIQMPDGANELFQQMMPDELQKRLMEEEAKKFSDAEKLNMTPEEFEKTVGDERKMDQHDLLIAMQRRNNGQSNGGNRRKKNKHKKPRHGNGTSNPAA